MSTMSVALRRARVLLVSLVAVVGLVAVGTAAAAHDVLIDSDPADGAVLDESPTSVVLTFNNPPLEVGSAISVVDADGATVAEGTGRVEGNDVVLDLDGVLPAGDLEVRWRVASSDGHPIEGTIPFTLEVEDAAVAEPTEDATTSAPAESTAPADGPAVTADAPAVTQEATTQEAEQAGGLAGLPTWLKVAIGIAALGSVAGLVVLVARRLRGDRRV